MLLRASAEQIGIAARMRDRVNGEDRQKLCHIVHSPNPLPAYGVNPYSACVGYDQQATKDMLDIAQRNTMPTEELDLAEAVNVCEEWLRRERQQSEDPHSLAVRVLALLKRP
jgi:hypothetical protein